MNMRSLQLLVVALLMTLLCPLSALSASDQASATDQAPEVIDTEELNEERLRRRLNPEIVT